jgi:hypothetical protein
MISIIQGEDAEITIRYQLENQDAYDLSAVTAITAEFRKTDGTVLTKTLLNGIVIVGGLPQNGKIAVTLTAVETALLKCGSGLDIETSLTEGVIIKIVQFPGQLEVLKQLL